MKGIMFTLGFLAGASLIYACAGAIGYFPYRYYALSLSEDCYEKGMLSGKPGKEGWPDLPLNNCKPDSGNLLKCLLMTDSDFYAAKTDFLKCEQDLSNCQKKCK
jgi:hypothetical protein